MKIGVQFYTIRDFCKDTESLAESLKRVADMGYTTVQLSGVCAYDPDWMDEQLKKNGLICGLTHFSYDKIKDEPLETINFHKKFGCSNVGIGSLPGGVNDETVEKFITEFQKPAEIIKENGGKLFYHNHHLEFVKGKDGVRHINKILDAFPPELLGITLDTFWLQYAGCDVRQWIDDLKGRLTCVHLKDLDCLGQAGVYAAIGEGNMNFPGIIESCRNAGTEFLFVEQDDCRGRDPFECLKVSYDYLKSLGLN